MRVFFILSKIIHSLLTSISSPLPKLQCLAFVFAKHTRLEAHSHTSLPQSSSASRAQKTNVCFFFQFLILQSGSNRLCATDWRAAPSKHFSFAFVVHTRSSNNNNKSVEPDHGKLFARNKYSNIQTKTHTHSHARSAKWNAKISSKCRWTLAVSLPSFVFISFFFFC